MFLKETLEKKLESSLKELNDDTYNQLMSKNRHIQKSSTLGKSAYKDQKDERRKINFPIEFKIFGDEHIKPNAKLAKKYVKALSDPDILELQTQKRWNISTKPTPNDKQDLKQVLFEVRHGLRDVKKISPKEKKIELGTDSRNVYYYGWNGSTKLEKDEKGLLEQENLERALNNTIRNWKTLQESKRQNNYQIFTNETYSVPFIYKSPSKVSEERNNIIRNFKKQNIESKRKIRDDVEYQYPKASEEKVSAIVYKRMENSINEELKKTLSKPWRKHTIGFSDTNYKTKTTTWMGRQLGTTTSFKRPSMSLYTKKDKWGDDFLQGQSAYNKTDLNGHKSGKSCFNFFSKKDWTSERQYHPGKWVNDLTVDIFRLG